LHQQVDDDGVEAPGVGGGAGVVARVLRFHRAQHQRAVGLDQAMAVHRHRDGRVLAARRGEGASATRSAARAMPWAPGLGCGRAGTPLPVLGPLDGRDGLPDGVAGQPHVLHPGGGDGASEGDDLGRGLGARGRSAWPAGPLCRPPGT